MTTTPRTLRELEQMPTAEAHAYWESLTGREQIRLANAMTPEEVEALPAEVKARFRNHSITTVPAALHELDAVLTPEGKFIHRSEDGEEIELTEEYCQYGLILLLDGFAEESEATIGFFHYHNQRLWIESYELLLSEYAKRKQG